ncbi:hypothetical protein ACFLYW_03460 [Thermodesulfobacteriota bacterium]
MLFLGPSLLFPGYLLARDVQYVLGEVLVKFKEGAPVKDTDRFSS